MRAKDPRCVLHARLCLRLRPFAWQQHLSDRILTDNRTRHSNEGSRQNKNTSSNDNDNDNNNNCKNNGA